MKKKVTNFVLVFFTIFAIQSRIVIADMYDTVCTYSNESVAKFCKAFHKNLKVQKLDNPGFVLGWPIDISNFWISSLYGYRTKNGVKKMHYGVDMAALKGTTVKATADGVVTAVKVGMPGYGNMIEIKHKSGFVSRYAHLHSIDIVAGSHVRLGEVIGTVGATGNVRGVDPSHLHFELANNGKKVDPLPYLYWSTSTYKKLKKHV